MLATGEYATDGTGSKDGGLRKWKTEWRSAEVIVCSGIDIQSVALLVAKDDLHPSARRF